jgi:polyphenol oxidase
MGGTDDPGLAVGKEDGRAIGGQHAQNDARRESIVAAVGPCIAQGSYEVDEGFRARFVADDAANSAFFAPGAQGRHQFDLESYVLHRLRACGIADAQGLALDTYARPASFYSYRRATHLAEPAYGRQFSLIALA